MRLPLKLHPVSRIGLACLLMACAAVSMEAEDARLEDLGTAELVESLSVPKHYSADTESDTKMETSGEPSIVGEAEREEVGVGVGVGRRGATPKIETNGFFTMSTNEGAGGVVPPPLVLFLATTTLQPNLRPANCRSTAARASSPLPSTNNCSGAAL